MVFDRQTWELRRAKEQAHLHEYYVQNQELQAASADRRAHVRSSTLLWRARANLLHVAADDAHG